MENFPIEELELEVRSYNCLKRVGIYMIGDLVTSLSPQFAAIPNFGKKSIEEVKETLQPALPGGSMTLRRGARPVRHQRSSARAWGAIRRTEGRSTRN